MDPTVLVRRFAAELGWNGIDRADATLTADNRGDVPVGTVVTCWSTSDVKFFIQINQLVLGEFGEYNVSVVAERYDIGPMDFESCKFDSREEAVDEALRLAPRFARANFRDRTWRRRYLEQNPEKLFRPKKRGWKRWLRPGNGARNRLLAECSTIK